MTSQEKFDLLEQRMTSQADAGQAEKMAAYMKNHFDFYGIPAGPRRLIYKDIIAADKKTKSIDWNLLDLAWASPKREMHYFVCDYLKALGKWLSFQDVPTILGFAKSNQWWDTIDHFDHILGSIEDDRRMHSCWSSRYQRISGCDASPLIISWARRIKPSRNFWLLLF